MSELTYVKQQISNQEIAMRAKYGAVSAFMFNIYDNIITLTGKRKGDFYCIIVPAPDSAGKHVDYPFYDPSYFICGDRRQKSSKLTADAYIRYHDIICHQR